MLQGDRNTKANAKARKRFRLAGNLLLILAVLAILHWWRSEPLPSGNAPPLTGNLVGADQFDLDKLRGKPVLVHFWATWCSVCRFGDDAIHAIARDFDVITVATQSGGTADIVEHLRKEGLSFPVITDPYGEIASRWGGPRGPRQFRAEQFRKNKIRHCRIHHRNGFGGTPVGRRQAGVKRTLAAQSLPHPARRL
jgi:thiol-disulfide isomerase/thioredoxin